MVKTFDDMQKTSDANVDATVHSLEGVTKVTQAIAGEITDYTKRSCESGTKTMENLLGARTLEEALEVHCDYPRAAYEDYVRHHIQARQPAIGLAGEATQPF